MNVSWSVFERIEIAKNLGNYFNGLAAILIQNALTAMPPMPVYCVWAGIVGEESDSAVVGVMLRCSRDLCTQI